MEITTFKIVDSLMVNPTNTTGSMIAIVMLMCILLGGYVLAFASNYTRKYSSSTRFLIASVALIVGVGVEYTINYIGMQLYPDAYTSHATCRYTLKNDNEIIEYSTLIPREHSRFCASVGTQLTRVKTTNFTKFFLDFETPL